MEPKTVHERRDEVRILDVREDEEWTAGRIEGSLHSPLGQLTARLGELDRSTPVVTVCRSGARAGKAAKQLARSGWTAHTMAGGLKAWAREGLPVTTPAGTSGRVA